MPGDPRRPGEPADATGELAADPLGFGRLYERLAPAVHAWVSLRLGRSARQQLEVEDVVQEVWLRAARAFPQFDPARGSFRGWIFQVTKYTLLDTFRALAAAASGGESARSLVLDLSQVPESVTSLTRRVAREEGLGRFLAEVETLPHEDKELLVICGLEGRPASEAAQQLDLTHEAARKRWLRLRERLAERAELAALIE